MASPFDPRHLMEDELAEEFAIRGIVETGNAGLEKLKLVILSEQAGVLPRPKAMPNIRPASEMRACREKLKDLSDRYQIGFKEADDSVLLVLLSRVTHLQERVHRLKPIAKTYDGIFDLVLDVDSLRASLIVARSSVGSPESLADSISAEGAAACASPTLSTATVTTDGLGTPLMATRIRSNTHPLPVTGANLPQTATTTEPSKVHQTNAHGHYIFDPARNSMPFNIVPPPNSDSGIIAAMQQHRHSSAPPGAQDLVSHSNTGAIPRSTLPSTNRPRFYNPPSNANGGFQQSSGVGNQFQNW